MKFKDYLKAMNEIAKEYPSSLKMEVIYSVDDEGNDYQKIVIFPSLCEVEDLSERNLDIIGYLSDKTNRYELESSIRKCNAILIN